MWLATGLAALQLLLMVPALRSAMELDRPIRAVAVVHLHDVSVDATGDLVTVHEP